jgi:hypothetical protein
MSLTFLQGRTLVVTSVLQVNDIQAWQHRQHTFLVEQSDSFEVM